MVPLTSDVRRLLQQHTLSNWKSTDRVFGWLLLVEWFACVLIALSQSTLTWDGSNSQIHPHVWNAVFLGGLSVAPPLLLIWKRIGATETRHAVAVGQSLMSGLLIHLTGGRIETHFHVFGSLAFLSFYRDWRVLITATAIVGLDHAARGLFWPTSVFGLGAVSPWRWLEHVGWVLYEDVFLIYSCRRGLEEMSAIAQREAEAASSAMVRERLIDERTAELRRSEQSLRTSRDRAEAANIAKSEFLANMSHEIRTPMTAILGFADMLFETGDVTKAPPERVEAIQTIRRNGSHLLALINDILDHSRIEAGKLPLESISCSPHKILLEVESLMHVPANAKHIQLKVEFSSPLPATISSDPTRIRQILVNLVGNAIKFTEQGEVKVIAGMASGQSPAIDFDVIDTGIGINPNSQAKLFQPFSQADNSTSRRFGGAGLGLTISRRLAKMLGGDLILVRSQLGVGSQLRFTLPVSQDTVADLVTSAPDEPALSSRCDANDSMTGALAGVRILVAEDGPDNQRLILHHLRKAGADTTLVDNGLKAVNATLDANSLGMAFDVVLLDIQMPIMDGYEAVRCLRDQSYRGPIIALTAHAMADDRQICLSAGCSDYLTKPLNRAELVNVIRRYVKAEAGTCLSVNCPASDSTLRAAASSAATCPK